MAFSVGIRRDFPEIQKTYLKRQTEVDLIICLDGWLDMKQKQKTVFNNVSRKILMKLPQNNVRYVLFSRYIN